MLLEHRKFGFFNGILLSVLLCLITFCFYLFDSDKLHETLIYPTFFYCVLLLFPIIILKKKYSIEKHFFRDCFSIVFLIQSIALFGFMIFTLLLYNVVDNQLIAHFVDVKMTDYSNIVNQVEGLDTNLESNFHDSLLMNFSIKSQFNSYIFSLIPCVLYAALISLLFKTKK